jgi:hypothetical protein
MTGTQEIDSCRECAGLRGLDQRKGLDQLSFSDKPYVAFKVEDMWKPKVIETLFVAESPPRPNKHAPYFYNPNPNERKTNLRKQVLKYLKLSSLEEFRDKKGYFLIDAIKCRLDKSGKRNVPLEVLRRCATKFLGDEIKNLLTKENKSGKRKTIFVLGRSAKLALEELSLQQEFADFIKLKKYRITQEFDQELSGYRVILCVYPSERNKAKYKSKIEKAFSRIAYP